jgi:hypothetical protein
VKLITNANHVFLLVNNVLLPQSVPNVQMESIFMKKQVNVLILVKQDLLYKILVKDFVKMIT